MDRIKALAHAIATAEGYFAHGPHDGHSLPWSLNNPGDLEASPIPHVGIVQAKLKFDTPDLGWAALEHQLQLIADCKSHVYPLSTILTTFAMKWTGGDNPIAWLTNLLDDLSKQGIVAEYDSTLGDILSPPSAVELDETIGG